MRSNHLTAHAQKRKQQRGILDLQLELIHHFGVDRYQKGGYHLSFIPERKLTELRDAIDKLRNVAIVKGQADDGVSVMHMDKRIRTTRYAA